MGHSIVAFGCVAVNFKMDTNSQIALCMVLLCVAFSNTFIAGRCTLLVLSAVAYQK